MKKTMLFSLIALVFAPMLSRGTAPDTGVELQVNAVGLYQHNEMRGIELVVGKNKVGTFFSVPVYGLFRQVLDTMSTATMARATFEFVNDVGQTVVLSACEIDSACSSVPAVILVAPRDRPPTKDTITLTDTGGDMDLSMLDGLVKEQTRMKRSRFQLPDTKVSSQYVAQLKTSSVRLICPRDRRTIRWINNITTIRLRIE